VLAGLTEQEWERLAEYFQSDEIPEAAMDLFELHGFMTALAIIPVTTEQADWLPVVMGEEADKPEGDITALMQRMLGGIATELDSGDGVELPMDLLPDDEEEGELLRSWCLGFVQGQMLNDEAWFGGEAERVAALSLPMAAFSGAMEEEGLGELLKTPAKRKALAEQIPPSLDELFLHFREEKK
jgi:uncharacterized protein